MGILIDSIKIRNFLSYGDYDTIVKINGLGPVLVMGEIQDEPGESNGAGKTNFLEAIVWCLFGRTSYKAKPGDAIVNYFTGQNCTVELKTLDGWVITRNRKLQNHNDLIITHNGKDVTPGTNIEAQRFINKTFDLDYDIFISSVYFGQFSKSFLEMSDTVRKATLERLLNIDRINVWASVAKEKLQEASKSYDILKSNLGIMKDNRKSNEDMILSTTKDSEKFDIDNITKIANLEEQCTSIMINIDKFKPSYDNAKSALVKISSVEELTRKLTAEENKINVYKNKISVFSDKITSLSYDRTRYESEITEIDNILSIDYKSQHDRLIENKNKSDLIDKATHKLQLSITSSKNDIITLNKQIISWNNKVGSCNECGQQISAEYSNDKISEIKKSIDDITLSVEEHNKNIKLLAARKLKLDLSEPKYSLSELGRLESKKSVLLTKISDIDKEINNINDSIKQLQSYINESNVESIKTDIANIHVDINKDEAYALIAKYNDMEKSRGIIASTIIDLKSAVNPYDSVIEKLKNNLKDINRKISDLEADMQSVTKLTISLDYIYKAYNDRKKIKSLILGKLVPLLNKRIQYYIDSFGFDVTLEFTSSLSIQSDKWGYDFCSGGEKKRIDIAIMFAIYDLYVAMYGLQCNILVLDEVDGRISSSGVSDFVKILLNDFVNDKNTSKPSTIFVISQKSEMVDALPAKMLIKRDKNRQSRVV